MFWEQNLGAIKSKGQDSQNLGAIKPKGQDSQNLGAIKPKGQDNQNQLRSPKHFLSLSSFMTSPGL